jgi:hypothetical protein
VSTAKISKRIASRNQKNVTNIISMHRNPKRRKSHLRGQMDGRGTVDGLDKRKACVFLILVAVGVLCLGILAYVLFYATPHSNTVLKNGGHGAVRQAVPPGILPIPLASTVRS